MNQFYNTTIHNITRLTESAVNIEIYVPKGEEDKFRFKPGQYLVVRIPAIDAHEHRSYSISAAPHENKLQIGVKKLEGGLISTHLVEKATQGDSIDIMPPQGSFTLESINSSIKSIVAMVAGSGITPVLSILKSHLLREKSNNALLIYGNKSSKDRMYIEELRSLENDYPVNFEDLFIYSKESTGMANLEGRIDVLKLTSWKEYLFDVKKVDAFLLCGPGDMVTSLENELIKIGVSKSKILTELFTAPIGSNALSHTLNEKDVKAANYKIEYKLNGKWHTVESKSNQEVILDMGMNHGLDLPYSCKSGVCSTCQAKLLSGEVKMDNNYVLSDKEIQQGFILTCQSHCMTDHVKVDYDMK